MHEYAVTENLVALVLDESKRVGAKKVKLINLVIGEISSILPESVNMYFELMVKGTLLEGAELNFKKVEAELKCNSCGKAFPKNKNQFECPGCGGLGVFTDRGKEFYIESIEIENSKD